MGVAISLWSVQPPLSLEIKEHEDLTEKVGYQNPVAFKSYQNLGQYHKAKVNKRFPFFKNYLNVYLLKMILKL